MEVEIAGAGAQASDGRGESGRSGGGAGGVVGTTSPHSSGYGSSGNGNGPEGHRIGESSNRFAEVPVRQGYKVSQPQLVWRVANLIFTVLIMYTHTCGEPPFEKLVMQGSPVE